MEDTSTMAELDEVAADVMPYRCERCGDRDDRVRLYDSCDPKRHPAVYRLLQLHPDCWRIRQGEADLGLVAS